ncbi:hypothetical protein [Lacticaseibacillus jixiensis]|uniref:hypothetical protein n=1 Tax=Lacticaseibacillus jixiensis TaxID=3231926 RepID=UPI0036F3C1FA
MWKLIRNLSRQRLIAVTYALGLELVWFVAVLLIAGGFSHRYTAGDVAGLAGVIGVLSGLCLFVVLAVFNERMWQRNTYRLLPVGGSQLLGAGIVSNVLAMGYFIIGQVVLIMAATWVNGSPITATNATWATGLLGLITLLSACCYGWLAISLIHLLALSFGNALPTRFNKLLQGMVYLVCAVLIIFALQYLSLAAHTLLPAHSSDGVRFAFGHNSEVAYSVQEMLNGCVYMLVMNVVFGAINTYLLNHHVQTRQQLAE